MFHKEIKSAHFANFVSLNNQRNNRYISSTVKIRKLIKEFQIQLYFEQTTIEPVFTSLTKIARKAFN